MTSDHHGKNAPVSKQPTSIRGWLLRKRVLIPLVVVGALMAIRPLSLWMATRTLWQGDPASALGWIVWAERIRLNPGEVALMRVRAHRRLGDFVRVRQQLLAAQKAGVPRKRLEQEQVLVLAQSGQMQLAEPHLAELLDRQEIPVDEVCTAYASGFLLTARPGEALRLIDAWLKDEPKNPEAYYLRGQSHALGRQFRESIQDFETARSLAPQRRDVALALGEALLELQQPAAAIPHFKFAAVETGFADAPRARFGLARATRRIGEPSQALSQLQRIVEIEPERAEVWEELGRTLRDMDQLSEARDAMLKAVELKPASVSARQAYAEILVATGDADSAKEHLEFALRANSDLERLRKLEDLAEKAPRQVETRWEIAKLYHQYDTADQALAWTRSVLMLDPTHREALSLVEELQSQQADKKDRPRSSDHGRHLE